HAEARDRVDRELLPLEILAPVIAAPRDRQVVTHHVLIHPDAVVCPADDCIALLSVLDLDADHAEVARLDPVPLEYLPAHADGVDAVLEELAQEDVRVTLVDFIAKDLEHRAAISLELDRNRPEAASVDLPVDVVNVETMSRIVHPP